MNECAGRAKGVMRETQFYWLFHFTNSSCLVGHYKLVSYIEHVPGDTILTSFWNSRIIMSHDSDSRNLTVCDLHGSKYLNRKLMNGVAMSAEACQAASERALAGNCYIMVLRNADVIDEVWSLLGDWFWEIGISATQIHLVIVNTRPTFHAWSICHNMYYTYLHVNTCIRTSLIGIIGAELSQ